MAKQTINIGSAELAGDGESLRSAFDKINDNFDDLYAANVSLDAQFLESQPGAFYLDYTNFVNTPQIPLDVADLTDSTSLLSGGFDGDYNSLTNKPTIPTAYTDADVDTHLNTSTATANQILSWDGADYAWVADQSGSSGIALTDLSVGAEDPASGDGGISYDNTTGVFTYAPPDLSLYQPVGNLNADIDAHLNTSTAAATQVLGWTGTDYDWVAQTASLQNIVDSAQGVNVTGKVAATDGIDIDIGGNLNAAGTTVDFGSATISFSGATVNGLSGVIKDTVEIGVAETFSTTDAATGVTALDCNNGHTFYLTNPAGDVTANFTNLYLNAEYATNLTVILNQGATGRTVTAIQIEGVAQTINWQGGSAPTGNANGLDAFSFTILNDGGTYVVLGQMVDFA